MTSVPSLWKRQLMSDIDKAVCAHAIRKLPLSWLIRSCAVKGLNGV